MIKEKITRQSARKGRPIKLDKQETLGYRPRIVVKFHDFVDIPY